MVYVNSKKFACESCIKGHRSSSCHHTDRPLFEIKKKGRPVSQCSKCRELRQSKKFHSKCTCNHPKESTPAVQPLASSSTSKTRRFIPIVPALPNGLKDVLSLSSSSISLPPDSRQRVDSLLNPCKCKSVWSCSCKSTSFTHEHPLSESPDALSTLAKAAAMFSTSPEPTNKIVRTMRSDITSAKRPHRADSLATSPVQSSMKPHEHEARQPQTTGPDLPPILQSPSSQLPLTPDFPSMPPISQITSLAGTGCTCGLQCSCPGCVEHRGQQHANREHKDCADGCGTCVDPTSGMTLPNLPNHNNPSGGFGTSFLDVFFARAAALPPPPSHRRLFGSVDLPKLECCDGKCSCPTDLCSCRTSCAGCCLGTEESVAVESLPPTLEDTHIKSCCAETI